MKWKIITIIAFIFLLTGCWNYRELNTLSITTGMAIDKEEDKYKVSVLISNAKKLEGSSKEGEAGTIVIEGEGKTILEALKDIGLKSPKEIYIRHLMVLIVSEDVAKDGLYQILDFLLREAQSRKTFLLAIARDCKAKDTLKILSPLESFPSLNIATNLKQSSTLQAILTDVTYNVFIEKLLEPGSNNVVNGILIEGSPNKGEKEDNLKQTEPDTMIKLGTLGIFKEDKFLGWSNKDESRGINVLNGDIETMYTIINHEDSDISITITSLSKKNKVKMQDGKPYIEVSIKAEGLINEINQHLDLEDPKVIEELEKKTTKEIQLYINKALDLTQKKYKSDIFSYGSLIHKEYPQYWKKVEKNWNEEGFTELEVKTKIDIQLKNKGSLERTIQ